MDAVQVSAGIGAMIFAMAAQAGADSGALLAATGFDPNLAADPDQRISIDVESALWDEASRLCGDPAFGLHTAQRITPGLFGVLDYAVRTAPDVRTALERLVRYNRIVHDAAVFTLSEQGERLRLEHSLGPVAQSRHAAEFTLASIVVLGREMTGTPFEVRAIEFRQPAPSEEVRREHERFFRTRPRFDQPVGALEIDRVLGNRPLLSADPMLSRVIEQHAEALLAARPEPAASLGQKVRALLSRTLSEGEGGATLAAVAARLRMSERSLQRRLAQENSSFDALLEELRRDLAERYLADQKVSVQEVAYLLGYSEPSAFNRAFKRWTGRTPSEARRRAA